MKRRLRAPSPALVIALIALFVALGGTTYAATSLPQNSVGTKQLKKNAVTGPKIKKGAVTASKINPAGLTVPNASHATTADSATNATSATSAGNADKLDNLDSTSFLRDDKIVISEQRGWVTQFGGAGTVDTFSNVQVLDGTSIYYLSLDTPNTVGVQKYYLDSVEICYDVDSPSKIDTTLINRSNTDNSQTVVVSDNTDRTTAYPNTECYSEPVHDSGAPGNSAYYVELFTSGTTTRMIRVTATYLPG